MEYLPKGFDAYVLFDLETTGIDSRRDSIIEFSALTLRPGMAEAEKSLLVQLPMGKTLPPEITRLTGITPQALTENGVEAAIACDAICQAIAGESPLLIAYNAQFDLCFLYYFLKNFGQAGILKKARFLDALTVYKDRRSYPHRLENAAAAYNITAENAHRAMDDVRTMQGVLAAMAQERDDLDRYINLFGYNPKFGVSGQRILSITYAPQPYNSQKKLYE